MAPLDPSTTALVLIDLQNGIVGMDLAPRTGGEVVTAARDLAARFREAGAPIILVHVGWSEDGRDRPSTNVSGRVSLPDELPAGWSDLVDGLRQDGDVVVIKRHWGAFTGTDLDLQLRRRGVGTVVVAGIATNLGVESTVRSAWELSYDIVVVEDVTTSRSADMHAFAVEKIMPLISRVVRAEDIAFATD